MAKFLRCGRKQRQLTNPQLFTPEATVLTRQPVDDFLLGVWQCFEVNYFVPQSVHTRSFSSVGLKTFLPPLEEQKDAPFSWESKNPTCDHFSPWCQCLCSGNSHHFWISLSIAMTSSSGATELNRVCPAIHKHTFWWMKRTIVFGKNCLIVWAHTVSFWLTCEWWKVAHQRAIRELLSQLTGKVPKGQF